MNDLKPHPPTLEQQASDTFVQRLQGAWTAADEAEFEVRLASDPGYADAWHRVEESWASLDTHAESPELMSYRAEAILYARRAGARRWRQSNSDASGRWRIAAAAAVLAVAAGTAWQLSPFGYRPGQYRTDIGEQRIVELDDHSRIALDAATRVQVRYASDARIVQLLSGQAQFSVAADPARPFKVQAGDRTIVALGTVFTVEYADRKVHVAMMEGKVAVVSPQETAFASQLPDPAADQEIRKSRVTSSSATLDAAARHDSATIELVAGEELHVSQDGHSVVTPKADLEAATAWRAGKIIFRTEPLGEAVRRMNRYSRLQLQIDDTELAARHISGVFEAGDTQGFILALQHYLPDVTAEPSDSSTLRLRVR